MIRTRNFPGVSGFSLSAVFLAMTMASYAPAQVRDLAEPVYLSFTPDGKWLVASYYRTPINRPGTDWAAWTVVWNTTTWAATRLANATMPFAESPDGRWLALGKYDWKNQRMGPQAKLALWTPGAEKPERVFTAEVMSNKAALPPDTTAAAAAAFDPSSKHVAWIDSDGTLWLCDVAPETSKPKILDQLKLTIPAARYGFPQTVATLKFADDAHLALDMTYSASYEKPGLGHVVWKIDVDAGKAERTEEKPGERKKPARQELHRQDPIKTSSPDKKLTATAGGLDVEIVNRATGGVIKTLSATPKVQ